MGRLRNYIESLLIAENVPPNASSLTMLINNFSQLVALSKTGRPILYKKRNTLSLLFDVFALQSEMSIDNPDDLLLGYTQSMMGFLLLQPDPRRIGMIGLGGGSLVTFCYRHLPDPAIEAAEINPEVIALRDHFHIPQDDERFQVRCIDGADFVRDAAGRFGALMVDGFDKHGQPAQLCSPDFYEDCYRALTIDGVMVVNLLGEAKDMEGGIERMRCAFGGAVVVIDALDSLNKIAFACKGDALDADELVMQQRISQIDVLHSVVLARTAQGIRAACADAQHAMQDALSPC